MLECKVSIEEGVDVSLDGDKIKVAGPLGELLREFRHPDVKIERKDSKIVLSSESERRKVKALLGTWRAHLSNMMTGVTKGWGCDLKPVYSHFPVKLETQGNKLIIKNFLGERSNRSAEILEGVEIKIEEDILHVSGIDKEKVGQTAANIEHATKVKGYDRRVFQDGIYTLSKPAPVQQGGSNE